MPNWCSNYASFVHDDKEAIDKIEKVLNSEEKSLFETFMPSGNWGTKWDINYSDSNRESDNEITISFETAWSPPTGFYTHMVENGYTIDANFMEEGIGFVGYYNNEEGEESWDYLELFETYGDKYVEHLPEDMAEMIEHAYEYWKECDGDE